MNTTCCDQPCLTPYCPLCGSLVAPNSPGLALLKKARGLLRNCQTRKRSLVEYWKPLGGGENVVRRYEEREKALRGQVAWLQDHLRAETQTSDPVRVQR